MLYDASQCAIFYYARAFFENHLLVHLAENSWYEVHTLLERQYDALTGRDAFRQTTLTAMRHCLHRRATGEMVSDEPLARESCTFLPRASVFRRCLWHGE
jgi:hypothetical protein